MVGAQIRQKVETALGADVDVEEDDRDVSVGAESSLGDGPTVELEVHPAEKSDRRVVVDDENGVTGRVHRGRQCTRNPIRPESVYRLKMGKKPTHDAAGREVERARTSIPRPSPQFRRRSWLLFQRALDPLARPRPLRERED